MATRSMVYRHAVISSPLIDARAPDASSFDPTNRPPAITMKPVYTRQQLLARRCRALDAERAYSAAEIEAQLAELPGWSLRSEAIERSYAFRDYHETIAFVNALARIGS